MSKYGSYGPACITVDDVNAAMDYAMKYHNYGANQKKSFVDYVGDVGDILTTVAVNVADRHRIPHHVAAALFPQIDTLQTNIRQICPKQMVPGGYYCTDSYYNRADGYCMNPYHPTWGGAGQPMKRFIIPKYADGLYLPKVSYTGALLPSVRAISNIIHGDLTHYHERYINTLFVEFGQFLAHDVTNSPTYSSQRGSVKCCAGASHPACMPINVHPQDYFYSKWKVQCLEFTRSRPAALYGCRLGHKTILNAATPIIDGSMIYGNSKDDEYLLRAYQGGRLKDSNPFYYGNLKLKSLLPPLDDPGAECYRDAPNHHCFLAGDRRANIQSGLLAMHTIFLRLHNHIVYHLYQINPHWNDDRLYLEGRRIVAAIIQHITYNEFLPNLIDPYWMDEHNLWTSPNLYSDYGFDPSWDPQVSVYFSAAAFRLHTLVSWKMDLYSPSHKFIGYMFLRDVFHRPKHLHVPGMVDRIMYGALNQPADQADPWVNDELRNWHGVPPYQPYGEDLVARHILRGRDQAMPGFVAFWRFCNLKPDIYTFNDLYWIMPNATVNKLRGLYAHVEDIDLWTGGVSEYRHGGLVGPTFACLLSEQFANFRRGDKFFYDNPGLPSSFTPNQLAAIKSISMARVLCDHLDEPTTVQRYAFLLPDIAKNPRLPCYSNAIPHLNLAPWREVAAPYGKSYKK